MTLREQVARRMGWEFVFSERGLHRRLDPWGWYRKPFKSLVDEDKVRFNFHGSTLPNWDESWEGCAKYVVPWMRERDFYYVIDGSYNHCSEICFDWKKIDSDYHRYQVVENDNLALAACQAFTEVEI